jgi:hypothetical protein
MEIIFDATDSLGFKDAGLQGYLFDIHCGIRVAHEPFPALYIHSRVHLYILFLSIWIPVYDESNDRHSYYDWYNRFFQKAAINVVVFAF